MPVCVYYGSGAESAPSRAESLGQKSAFRPGGRELVEFLKSTR